MHRQQRQSGKAGQAPPGVPLAAVPPSPPALTFPRSALTEQGAKTIAYNQSKNESKRNKQTRQKAKEKGKPINYIVHTYKSKRKEKQVITDKQDKEKSKRDPRKAYKQTSKREKKAILFPPYAYM